MNDTVSVTDNAMKDAAAMIAALIRGDIESYEMLAAFYTTPEEISSLCGALAAFATSTLKTVDSIRDEMATVHGIPIPSSQQVLSTVLLRLSEPKA